MEKSKKIFQKCINTPINYDEINWEADLNGPVVKLGPSMNLLPFLKFSHGFITPI